jgi:hypothetical protein
LTRNPPPAFVEWERALCRHFLTAQDGDAAPIRAFEISSATLAEAFSRQSRIGAEEARERFQQIFADHSRVFEALEHGRYTKLDESGVPGCFSFLVLTLLWTA